MTWPARAGGAEWRDHAVAEIAFIGGGVMAEAMISSLIDRGVAQPSEITVGEIDAARREYLARTHKVGVVSENAKAAAGHADGTPVIIALKPQHIDALRELKGAGGGSGPIVSIAAGVPIARLRELTGRQAVVRVMPNTPAQIGLGMSVWTATAEVGDSSRELVSAILGAMGRELYVHDERYIDMATALSGSGPGYVFLFLEALIDAGVHIGLQRDQAELLARQTLLGSAALADQSGRHPAELRNMVTSPGGTTAEGLAALEQGGLRAAVAQAVIAAHAKSRQLS